MCGLSQTVTLATDISSSFITTMTWALTPKRDHIGYHLGKSDLEYILLDSYSLMIIKIAVYMSRYSTKGFFQL